MSDYCEKCHLICEQEICPFCGNKELRVPENSDYCFLTEANLMFSEMFENILKEENIPYVGVPSGNGVRSCFALKLENHKIYVMFEFLLQARELLSEIVNNFEENRNGDLLENIDKLHAHICEEKKIKKSLKLATEENLVAYCADRIIHADKIVDEGRISSCTKGGYYLFVYKDDELFIINSATYEIISAKKVRREC